MQIIKYFQDNYNNIVSRINDINHRLIICFLRKHRERERKKIIFYRSDLIFQ